LRFLFVMGHPAHVHLFRNAIAGLRKRGHEVSVAAVKKETTITLLTYYKLQYEVFGVDRKILTSKVLDILPRDLNLLKFAARVEPEIIVSTGSPYAAQVSKVLGIPHVAFGDTEIAGAITKMMLPFTDAICTPSCFSLDLGPKQIRYNGYKEIAYLHPNYFRPDSSVLDELGVKPGAAYSVVRLASWTSSHDVGERGFGFTTTGQVMDFLNFLEGWGRVFLTTERPLPKEFDHYTSRLPLNRVHDLLNYASLYIGEGATMASEAGVLGTPWIFVSEAGRGYLTDQQANYALGFHVKSEGDARKRAEEILSNKDVKAEWGAKRRNLLHDKIDVTAFIINFLERWPESFKEEKRRAPGK
jgi:predicted glycosyltransferase